MADFTHNYPELLETRQKALFFLEDQPQDLIFPQLFSRMPLGTPFIDRLEVAGLGGFEQKREGEPVAFSEGAQGVRRRVPVATYALGYRITHEAQRDDQWAILDKMPGDLRGAAMDFMERLAWDVINDGFDGNTHTGIDGVSLFNASHTSPRAEVALRSNIESPPVALSSTGLESIMTKRRTTKSREGRFINVGQAILVIPPDLEHRAYELLETTTQVNTNNNNVSTVQTSRSGLRTLISPYLTSTSAWSVHDGPGNNGLEWHDREELNFSEARDSDTFDRKFYAMFRSLVTPNSFVGNWGSNAA